MASERLLAGENAALVPPPTQTLPVHWNEFIQAANVRACEDADAARHVWTPEQQRAATDDAARKADGNTTRFVRLRSAALCAVRRSKLATISQSKLVYWFIPVAWLLAFAVGWLLAGIGQDREINLLALPLIGILMWNFVIVLLSLLMLFRKKRIPPDESEWSAFVRKHSNLHAKAVTASQRRLVELVLPASTMRLSLKFCAWLHIGAALLALGSISAMYARGWSREYRAVWESTLLDEKGTTTFFDALFSPASLATGVSIPLKDVPEMRRGVDHEAKLPGAALPWIHLYAGTLLLFVIAPRLLLAGFETWRASRVADTELSKAEWQNYARRLMSFAAVGNAKARVLVLGVAVNEDAEARWRLWLRRQLPDIGALDVQTIVVGAEPEFVAQFVPGAEPVLLVFSASSTPETEVQRDFVFALMSKISAGKRAAPLMLGLDETELRKRWSGLGDFEARLATRVASWHAMMQGLNVEWL